MVACVCTYVYVCIYVCMCVCVYVCVCIGTCNTCLYKAFNMIRPFGSNIFLCPSTKVTIKYKQLSISNILFDHQPLYGILGRID